jgi:hypothetical protein
VSRVTPPAGHRGAVLAGLIMVLLLAALDGTIVATALPTIVAELGGLAHLAWVVTARRPSSSSWWALRCAA